MSLANAEPGETTSVRFTIQDSGANVAGIYVDLEQPEQFSLGSASGLAEVTGGVTHTSPRPFSGGEVTYELTWNVPSTPGATRFSVGWVAANGNRNNGGDEGHAEDFDVVYGCQAQTFYRDFDGDGFGSSDLPRDFCAGAPPAGYAAEGGDCFEGSSQRYPGAVELCNQRDDDCDGEIDEGAIPVELYPDEDGDGFYSANEKASGDVMMGCVPTTGYAAEGGDCDADNPNAHPEAEEVCDLFTDEDCNGRVDDRVKPLCGVGWCVRESFTCDEADCIPGQPNEEACNFIDDDCDGEVDEGELCEKGFVCAAGECRDASEVGVEGGDTSGSGVGTDSPGSSGSEGNSSNPTLGDDAPASPGSGSKSGSLKPSACSSGGVPGGAPGGLGFLFAIVGLALARSRFREPTSWLFVLAFFGCAGCEANLGTKSSEPSQIGGADGGALENLEPIPIADPPTIEETLTIPETLQLLDAEELCVDLAPSEKLIAVDPNGIAWFAFSEGGLQSVRTFDPQAELQATPLRLEMEEIVAAQAFNDGQAALLTANTLWSWSEGSLQAHALAFNTGSNLCGDPHENGAVLAAGKFMERRASEWWSWEPAVAPEASLAKLVDIEGECYEKDDSTWMLGADDRLWRVSRADVQLLFSDVLSVDATQERTGVLTADSFYVGRDDWQRWLLSNWVVDGVHAGGEMLWLKTESELLRFNGEEFRRLPRSIDAPVLALDGHNGGLWIQEEARACHYATQDSLRIHGLRPGERAEREDWALGVELNDTSITLEADLNGARLEVLTPVSQGRQRVEVSGARVGWNQLELKHGTARRKVFFKRIPSIVRSFATDVAPIAADACVECHSSGGDAEEFPLETYEDWLHSASEIRKRVIETETMPPVLPVGWEGQAQVIAEWLEGELNP